MRDSDDYAPLDAEQRSQADAYTIAHCEMCDENGIRGLHRCDHRTDFAATAARHMPRIREILAKKGRTNG